MEIPLKSFDENPFSCREFLVASCPGEPMVRALLSTDLFWLCQYLPLKPMATWLLGYGNRRFFAVGVAKMMAIDDANIFKATKHFFKADLW